MLPYNKFQGKLDDRCINDFVEQLDYLITDIAERMEKVKKILYIDSRCEFLHKYFDLYFNQNRLPRPHFYVTLSKLDSICSNDYVCKQLEHVANYVLLSKDNLKYNDTCEYPVMTNSKNKKIVKNEVSYERYNESSERESSHELRKTNLKKYSKVTITNKDIEDISYIEQIQKSINSLKKQLESDNLSLKLIFKYRKLVTELKYEQINIKEKIRQPIEFKQIGRDSTKLDYDSDTGYYDNSDEYHVVTENRIDFSNQDHIYHLIEHYSRLKQDCYTDLHSDMKYILLSLDDCIENSPLKDFERDIIIWKIDGISAKDICVELQKKYGLVLSDRNLSYVYKRRICWKIAKYYEDSYTDWFYINKAKGEYKRCSCCGNNRLMLEFHKNKTKKDGLEAYCKECRKKKVAL